MFSPFGFLKLERQSYRAQPCCFNKVSFLLTALYFIILPILSFKLKTEVFITGLCGLTLLVMYGLQAYFETKVLDLNYSKEYAKLNSTSKKVCKNLRIDIIYRLLHSNVCDEGFLFRRVFKVTSLLFA